MSHANYNCDRQIIPSNYWMVFERCTPLSQNVCRQIITCGDSRFPFNNSQAMWTRMRGKKMFGVKCMVAHENRKYTRDFASVSLLLWWGTFKWLFCTRSDIKQLSRKLSRGMPIFHWWMLCGVKFLHNWTCLTMFLVQTEICSTVVWVDAGNMSLLKKVKHKGQEKVKVKFCIFYLSNCLRFCVCGVLWKWCCGNASEGGFVLFVRCELFFFLCFVHVFLPACNIDLMHLD